MVMDLGSKAVCMCGMRPRPSAINPEKHRVPREPADCWLMDKIQQKGWNRQDNRAKNQEVFTLSEYCTME